MQEKWKEIWKKWNKKILIIMLCIIIFLVLGIIVANAKKMQIIFDPSVYSDSKDKEEESVDYDSAVFGADQKNKDGLEMDDESEESYDLDEGDEKLLDDQNNESSQGLQIADGDESGNGASSENRNTVGVTNDENGATILGTNQNRPMSGGSGTGEGTGGPGTSSGDGNGSGTGTGSGGSTGNPGTGTEEGGGSGTGSSENPGPDPDEDKYGTDYNEKEEIDSVFPDEAEDQEKGITAVSLKISKGSLRQHFFEGEAPRCSEMMEYITVDATMSDGSVRKNLLYHPTSDYDFGGDYTVTWEANPDNTLNQYGYPIVGKDVSKKDYTATITYRGVSCKTSYDIVHWELNLKDFDEAEQEDSFVEPYVQQYIENTTNISPKDTPVIDLYDPMQAMYNLIEARTESHDDPETTAQYRYINKKRDGAGEYDAYYVEYFGGWTDAADMESTGNIYKMKRPTDAQIKDGEYIVDMIPVWSDEESKGDYQIGLYGVLDTTWSTELLGYSGDSSTLIVPQGTTRFSIPSMYYYAWGEGDELQDTKIKKLVLPASLYEYENIPSTDYVNFFPNLEEIEVSADNQYYMSIDGVLYNRTGKLLMSVPAGKKSIDEWSTRPFQIMPDAFQYVNMDRVDVPANVSICGINSFFNATIGTLTINYPGTLTLGMSAFDSCLLDENYSPVLGIKKIVLKASDIKWDGEGILRDLFYNLNQWGADLAEMGLEIVVPDSADDKVYLSYLQNLPKGIDSFTNRATTYSVLKTENHAEQNYSYENGFILAKDRKTVYLASLLMAGDQRIPEGVEKIMKGVFEGCDLINSMGIPSSVKVIEDGAFADTEKLSALYMYGEIPADFGRKIFGESIPENLKIYVPDTAYEDYIEKAASILDSDYGEGTAKRVFTAMESMSDSVFYEGSIYYKNADDTYSLYKVKEDFAGIFTPMAGTSVFKKECFANYSMIKGVVIPDTVTTLEEDIFAGCQNLQMLASNAAVPPITHETAFAGISKEQIRLLLPNAEGTEASYQSQNWTGFLSVEQIGESYVGQNEDGGNCAVYSTGTSGAGYTLIQGMISSAEVFPVLNDTTEIYPEAFKGSDIVGVSNSSSVTKIGESAFEGCSLLEGVELSSSISVEPIVIGKAAFKNCVSLSSLTSSWGSYWGTAIPHSIATIPEECFYGCTALVDVTCPFNLVTVGRESFAGCTGMEIIRFKESVENFSVSSFEGCTSLEYVISTNPADYGDYYSMPYGLKEVPENCFKDCSSLKETWLQSEVTRVGDNAFLNCSSLEYMAFPVGLTSLGDSSFKGCSSMTEVYADDPVDEEIEHYISMPYNITSIPAHCFEDCISLEVAEIQSHVTYIGERAFGNCTSLVVAIIKGKLELLETTAFEGDTLLQEVDMEEAPANMTDLSDAQAICDTYFKGCPLSSLIIGGVNLLDGSDSQQQEPAVEAYSIQEEMPEMEEEPEKEETPSAEPTETPSDGDILTEETSESEAAAAESEPTKEGQPIEGDQLTEKTAEETKALEGSEVKE